jgi:tetratricopeptide (TPR) repeat protein
LTAASVISINYAHAASGSQSKANEPAAISQFKALMEAGKLKEAYELETDAIKKNPKDPLAHKQLSVVLGQMGDFQGAIREAQTSVSLNAKDAEAHNYLAVLYHMMGKPDVALTEYNTAIKLDKNNIDAKRGHAQCLVDMGKTKEALAELTKVAADNAKNIDVWLSLSKIYYLSGNKADSDKALNKALALNPNYYPAVLFEANRDLQNKQVKEAAQLAHKLIDLNPEQPIGYLMSASIATMGENRIEDARFVYKQALAKKPKDVTLFVGLANVFNRQGHIGPQTPTATTAEQPWRELTEQALNQAVTIAPNRFDTNMNIAQLYMLEHKPGEAVSYAQKAVQLDPKNKDAQKLLQESTKEKGDIAASVKEWFNSLFNKK